LEFLKHTVGDHFVKEMKSESKRDTSTPIFIAALFTVAKILKQPTCLFIQINNGNMVYTYSEKLFILE
jgi:hypothetical protein